jgi:hypothetical protein
MKSKIAKTRYWCGVLLLVGNVVYLPIWAAVSIFLIPLYVVVGILQGIKDYLKDLSSAIGHRTWCIRVAQALMTDSIND